MSRNSPAPAAFVQSIVVICRLKTLRKDYFPIFTSARVVSKVLRREDEVCVASKQFDDVDNSMQHMYAGRKYRHSSADGLCWRFRPSVASAITYRPEILHELVWSNC